MPLARKRHADHADTQSTDTPRATQRRQRPREDSSDAEMSDRNDEVDTPSGADAMTKKLVRLALASEYSRLPIRRTDIRDKVLGEHGSRQFKLVFDTAQSELRSVFGMEMTELPAREKVTVTQRRAALKSEKQASTTTKSWVLTSTLPAKFRTPDILVPTRAPSSALESTYTALYSFVIAVITLNKGVLAEPKLFRYLARMNADMETPVDSTEKLLQRLCKEGYLVKTREMDGGDEVIEYHVGPRGKIEVGTTGVAGLVREVYGFGRVNADEDTQVDPEERELFEQRLNRSLGLPAGARSNGSPDAQQPQQGSAERARPAEPRRSSRRGRQESESEDESESD
ncbi:hypothetical protein N7492_004788 [Penicillium capsulatum]|uniref:MAGE domain-containing protein n=1 Tax=Penicillium capsulatum TaxID=69766 RepID=A0A9W9LRA8_9EURO|nr:hypothetical protein N7492_004788 [Penicillium capsulatum]KAJ6136105.1 hypothetical protein N7512_001265 [Penicillium capsulatum]